MEKIQHGRIDDQRKKACVKLIVTNLKALSSQGYSKSYLKNKIRFYEKKWDKARKHRFSWFYYRMIGSEMEILGTGSYDNEGQIIDVFVDIDHQRNGVGREIMAHLESGLARKQILSVFVYCGQNSVPFYQNLGYKETERMDQKGDIEIRMEKKLPPYVPPPQPRGRMSTLHLNDEGQRMDITIQRMYEKILVQNYNAVKEKVQLEEGQELSMGPMTISGAAGNKTYSEEDLKQILQIQQVLAARGDSAPPVVLVQRETTPPNGCPKCGKPINRNFDHFCPHCGNQLTNKAKSAPKSNLTKFAEDLKTALIQLSKSSGARLQTSDPAFRMMMQAQQQAMGETGRATTEELNDAVSILSQAFASIQPGISFIAMVTVGAFVESGADPIPAYETVIPYFEGVLNQIGNPAAIPMVYEIAGRSYVAIVAILSKSKSARKKIKERERFMGPLKIVWKNFSGGEYLWEIIHVEDDRTALVLHPETLKGYLVNYGGISSGFQFQTLLEDLLIQNDDSRFLTGTKNDPLLVAQMKNAPNTRRDSLNGFFSMFRAEALDENGLVPESVFGNMAAWITGETLPADIPRIDGHTCVLLSEQKGNIKINRSWNSERRFPQMEAFMSLVNILTQVEVEEYLKRIAISNQ